MYTSTDLINLIKTKVFTPGTQNTFTDADICQIASSVLESEILPLVMSTKNSFYLYSDNLTPDSLGYIRIPYRAVGNSIAEIRDQGERIVTGYTFENAYIRFMPVTQNPFKVYYYLRPGKITTDYAQISNIQTIGGVTVATVNTVPTTFTTSLLYDITRKDPGFELAVLDTSITTISGSDITFSSDLSGKVQVGDIITISDTAFVPNVPVELFHLLAHLTAISILSSNGDFEAATFLDRQTKELKHSALTMISPRSQNQSKAIVKRTYSLWRN